MKTIRDSVHGDMAFTAEEISLVDTRAFQRLRGIKQLGTTNLVFPSAVHTRFEHSLGTAWMTRTLLAALEAEGSCVDDESARVAVASGLLHDVTHLPFGHTFEDERRIFPRHDEDSDRLEHFLTETDLASPLERHGLLDGVRSTLDRTSESSASTRFVADLVRGTVCADLLDYLKRDARFTGFSIDYDDRLLRYFTIADGRLAVRLHKGGQFRRDALSELVHLLQLRFTLTERVYYHHSKAVSGAMISRALELAMDAGEITERDLYSLRDDGLMLELRRAAERTVGDEIALLDLIDDLESHRLYRRAYLLPLEGFGESGLGSRDRDDLANRFHFDVDRRRLAERELAGELNIPESHVIVYCPSASMSLKEADVPVELSNGSVLPLSAVGHPDVDALKLKHERLWKFMVCVRRTDGVDVGRAASVCERYFGFPNRIGADPLPGR